jgi:hypothetical protein
MTQHQNNEPGHGQRSAIPARGLSRRGALGLAAGAAAAGLLTAAGPAAAAAVPGRDYVPPDVDASLLPSLSQVYRDNATMVDFGPRFTGSRSHNNYLSWVREELERAGCQLLPDQDFPCNLWEAQHWGLTVLEGPFAGEIPVAAYYPRCGPTPDEGTVGDLAYVDLASPPAAGADFSGKILLVDTHLPASYSRAYYDAELDVFLKQPGDESTPWKKLFDQALWTAAFDAPGAHTAAGIVCIVDASYAALAYDYMPPLLGAVGTPVVYVDRNTGASLRQAVGAAPPVRLTVTATRTATTSPSITAILPGDGSTDRVLIGNTHSDGVNFVEENGGLGLIELARYFHQRKLRSQGLRHDLVLSFVTGHFNADPPFPQTQGFIDAHPDLIARTSAALTIEHLGVTDWVDDQYGYHPTGWPELAFTWVADQFTSLATSTFERYYLPNHRLAHIGPKLYPGVGPALSAAGVPSMAFLGVPDYLLTAAPDGCLDKLDPALMRRQLTWFTDILQQLDAQP